MEKCATFMQWCDQVGIKTPKLEYPAYFEGGLVGVRAKQNIQHREMILSVPYKNLMSIDKAKSDPILGRVYQQNNKLFGK